MSLHLKDQAVPQLPPGHDPAQLYSALLETMGDAVIFTDLEGRIQFWNRGASRIFGYTAEVSPAAAQRDGAGGGEAPQVGRQDHGDLAHPGAGDELID